MAPTLPVSDKTRNRLIQIMQEDTFQNLDELLEAMITQYRRAKLRDAQDLFRGRMDEKNLTPDDLVNRS